MVKKRILITGANRGIGYEVARQLGEAGHVVILGGRSLEKIEVAAQDLRHAGIDASFCLLDLERPEELIKAGKRLAEEIDVLDVLINNAAVYLDGNQQAHNVNFEIVRKTLQINLLGAWELTNTLLPLLKRSTDPRVINVSTGMGAFTDLGSGYPAYRVSKTALNSITKILASELPDYRINAMCPGWVRTDMGGPNATRSVEKGAETAVWLALDNTVPSGKFFRDMRVIPW